MASNDIITLSVMSNKADRCLIYYSTDFFAFYRKFTLHDYSMSRDRRYLMALAAHGINRAVIWHLKPDDGGERNAMVDFNAPINRVIIRHKNDINFTPVFGPLRMYA